MSYVLCEVSERYDHSYERSVYRVSKPLQLFNTAEEAENALDLFSSFYGYNLRVVSSDDLDSEFR